MKENNSRLLGREKLSMEALGRMSKEEFKDAQKIPVLIVLDNVRSMHNVGSVFRTADAFLMEGIWLCGFTPRPPHRDIHKTALGATETVTWHYRENALELVKQLKLSGYKILSVEQVTNSIPLSQFTWNGTDKLVLVFGNEVDGVQQSIIDASDACLEIMQLGTKHSLNISVSAGIVLYKLAEVFMK
ncbi:MAG: RNA methyltransferase [Bacteroidota bacterium]